MALNLNGTTGIVTGNIGALQVTSDKLASGAARANFGAGCVLQVVQDVNSAVWNSLNSTTFADVPDFAATITPSSTSNKILVTVSMFGSCTSNCAVRLMRDSTPIGVNTTSPMGNRRQSSTGDFFGNSSNTGASINFTYLDSPSLNTAITYKMQYITTSGYPFCLNANYADADSAYVCRGVSTLTLMEIAG